MYNSGGGDLMGSNHHGLRPSYPHTTPKIISPDQSLQSEIGDKLILPCQVANLERFVLVWKKGKRVLTAGDLVVRKDPRIKLRSNNALEIANLKPEDQGTYTCEIDVLGDPISIEHKVSLEL